MPEPSFKHVTDLLCLPSPELAELFNAKPQTIRQMRLDPTKAGYRRPPKGWEKKLATLARARGGELVKLAEKLEGKVLRVPQAAAQAAEVRPVRRHVMYCSKCGP